MAICKLCLEDKKLIKAHIIPESFFRVLKGSFEYLSVVPSQSFAKAVGRTYIGEYDKNILCKECDSNIGVWDHYGKTVLIDQSSRLKPIINDLQTLGWELNVDSPLDLYKFVLSMLWRASISDRPYYKLIDLGPHEEKVKLAIEKMEFNESYEVYFAKFDQSSLPGAEKSILNPYTTRIFDRNFCRFHINGFLISIKVDKQKLDERIRKFSLKDNEVKIIRAGFDSTGQLDLMLNSYPKK